MKTNKHFIKVLLDENAIILEFECTLRNVKLEKKDIIGKNWFDVFIENTDKLTVMEVFKNTLAENTQKWKTYKNDIICSDKSHKYIDFENDIIIKDGKKVISSFGVESMDNY